MTDSRAAYDPNRLPWLSDTPQRSPRTGWPPVLLWGMLALLLVAAVGYWAGLRSGPGDVAQAPVPTAPLQSQPSQPQAVAPPPPRALPTAPALEPTPEAEPSPPPLVQAPALHREESAPRTAEQPALSTAQPLAETPSSETAEALANVATASGSAQTAAAPPATPPKAAPRAPATRSATALWPADQSENAYGRVVRIGTFSTRLQAKRAWWRVVKVYPGMRRLKATVVANPSLRNGRTYYRLQFGTSSQAHSTVLCQRMRIVGQSCVVIGVGGA